MKIQATLKNLRIAPRKVRLVTHSVVGMDTREALVQLSKQTKRSSRPIFDLLKSAVANATNNNGLDETNLYILEIRVGDGLRLKRWLPRAFGRATPLLHRGSNVTIILEERVVGQERVAKPKANVSTEQLEAEHGTGKEIKKSVQPDIKKGMVKNTKPINTKVVKKIFQRKSV